MEQYYLMCTRKSRGGHRDCYVKNWKNFMDEWFVSWTRCLMISGGEHWLKSGDSCSALSPSSDSLMTVSYGGNDLGLHFWELVPMTIMILILPETFGRPEL